MNDTVKAPTVLIVDDDKGLARLIEKAVRRDGLSTAIVLSGEGAIAWLKNHRADLMLLDLKLPDLHGNELLTRLESISCAVPFIIITGEGDVRVAVDMMKRGALDYLVKDAQLLEILPNAVRRSLAHLDSGRRLAGVEAERRRLEQEILAVSEREQRRAGQDLHDGLYQVLAAISMLAHVLERRLAESSARDAEVASTISSHARRAVEQARMLARGLSPVEVEPRGLMRALEEMAQHTSTLLNVDCGFRCDEPVLFGDHAKATHLYRIAQEAINNAVKHGRAGRIGITLIRREQTVVVEITDDGSGFQISPNPRVGMGLRIMKYRADVINGRLEIRPRIPRGTAVICTVAAEPFTDDFHGADDPDRLR